MFDVSREFEIRIISGGDKTCRVRFPTDEEWIARAAKQRLVRRMLGRGKSSYDAPADDTANLELLQEIRKDADGEPFDEAEAANIIARLERVASLDVERIADEYQIGLGVPGGATLHVLRIPSQKDVLEYSRASLHVTEARSRQEIRVSLQPAGKLYDKLAIRTEGYAGSVPIVHKAAAITELLAAIQGEEEDSLEDFR